MSSEELTFFHMLRQGINLSGTRGEQQCEKLLIAQNAQLFCYAAVLFTSDHDANVSFGSNVP